MPNYYGIGHSSLDNYIAMIGGQPPNPTTQADCPHVREHEHRHDVELRRGQRQRLPVSRRHADDRQPADLAGLTWGAYMDGMGTDPARESATCPVPTVGAADNTESAETAAPYDQYANRHDPFLYYHSITDNLADCQSHVVNLNQLPAALSSVATTPNYVFITPDLCNDGHNTSPNCAPGEPGGLAQVNTFLQTWVPQILNSPAYKQDGLLLVTFDEGVSDDSACCGEIAGPGRGESRRRRARWRSGRRGAAVAVHQAGHDRRRRRTTTTRCSARSRTCSAWRTSATRSCRARPTSARTSTPTTRRATPTTTRAATPPPSTPPVPSSPSGVASRVDQRKMTLRFSAAARAGGSSPSYEVQVRDLSVRTARAGGRWRRRHQRRR